MGYDVSNIDHKYPIFSYCLNRIFGDENVEWEEVDFLLRDHYKDRITDEDSEEYYIYEEMCRRRNHKITIHVPNLSCLSRKDRDIIKKFIEEEIINPVEERLEEEFLPDTDFYLFTWEKSELVFYSFDYPENTEYPYPNFETIAFGKLGKIIKEMIHQKECCL